jgi:hypothetical protein
MNTTTTLLAVAASGLVLAACGSGPDTAAAPVAPVAAPQPAASAPPASAADPARPAPVSDPGAEVDADDQSGDGTTVVVRDARITVGPGWVAVRTDDDDNGGRLLGSAAVAPDRSGPVTVTLTEPVPAGDEDLTVVLHADDGDGVFDEQLDPRVLDGDDDDQEGDDQDDDDIEDDDFEFRLN